MRPNGLGDTEPEEGLQRAEPTYDSTAAFTPATTDGPVLTGDGTEPKVVGSDVAFADRYELGKVLGRGGFGIVYQGFDRRLGRAVAIKLSRPEREGGGQVNPLLQEARQAAQLQHPGIVTVHDVGEADGRCMIVSELLDGLPLDEWTRTRKPGWGEIAKVVADVADALGHAHSRGIIHRDVKPSNIMVVGERRPVLLDLGLALSEVDARSGQGQVLGTLSYMSPEQAQGEGHQPDGRTDIYSLGVVLYEMLSGRRPHRAAKARDLLWQIVETDPQPPRQVRPEIPVELERICLKAMSRQPKDRYSAAPDLAAELRRFDLVPFPSAASPSNPVPAPPAASTLTQTEPALTKASFKSTKPQGPERRQVTVLRCLIQQTPFNFDDDEGIDLEEEHDRRVAVRRTCESIVAERGGLALPSEGDSFLACFGYPTSREDSPKLAVAAGLEIRRVAAEATGIASVLRLAVETGQVVIGVGGGTGPPTILGEAVANVDRLARDAEPGELVIGATTRRLVRGFFECQEVGDGSSVGRATAYRVLAERNARNRIEATGPDQLTPLIGRTLEVELLKERWERAKEGDGHVMMLVADPGLGKSRLVHVLKEHLAGDDGASADSIIEWYGSEHHRNSPLQPVIDYYLRAFGLSGLTGPEAKLGALVARLEARGFADPTVHALFASALSISGGDRLPPLEMSPDRIKERSLELFLEWLDRVSDGTPVLFIVEDLHWFDPTTLELLRLFVDGGSGSRGSLLAIFTTRPEFDAPWKGKSNLTSVALTKFSRRQITEMMTALTGVGEVPSAVVDQILERTDGVPLFVEEFTRMLAEARPSWADPDASESSFSSSQLTSIPATLQDLLVARLDRVAGNKALIQLGATIGRSFDFEMISAVADLDESTLGIELGKLVEVGMLFAKGVPPRSVYTFKHALIQDSAYQLLLKKPRQQFHLRIAEALETRFPDLQQNRPELLAHHFTEGGDSLKAIRYWTLAAGLGAERWAHQESLSHVAAGLAILDKLPASPDRDRQELQLQMIKHASILSSVGYAAPQLEEVIARNRQLCLSIGTEAPLFATVWGAWAWRMIRDEYEHSIKCANDLWSLAESSGRDDLKTEAYVTLTCSYLWSGRVALGREACRAGLELFDLESSKVYTRYSGQNAGVMLMQFKSMSLFYAGYPDQARASLVEGEALAKEVSHAFSSSCLFFHNAFTLAQMRDSASSVEYSLRGEKLAIEHGFPFWIGMNRMTLGAGLLLGGKKEAARDTLIDGITRTRNTGANSCIVSFLGFLAEAHWQCGESDAARKTLEQGFDQIKRLGGCGIAEVDLHATASRFLLAEERHAEAREAAGRALAVARKQESPTLELRAALALARIDGAEFVPEGSELALAYGSLTEGRAMPESLEAQRLLGLN